MLLILLACFYITFICLTWGVCIYELLKKLLNTEQNELSDFSITCLLGLAGIIIVAGILSLFMPLGGWRAQLVVLTPCIGFIFSPVKESFRNLIKTWNSITSPAILIAFLSCLLLVLVMSSWKIIHPDTLGYHAQTIQWIEDYKAIPGLVHLNLRYGYQGLWFPACALFSFKFHGGNTVAYLNTAVVIWYLFFVIKKISNYVTTKKKSVDGLLWVALLAISLWSYTQVRLTVTSFSPDFIATIFAWAILYLFLENNRQNKKLSNESLILIVFLCLTAITIKLSVVPILLLAAYASMLFVKRKKTRFFFLSLAIAALTLFPFIARNTITSGYFFFPVVSTNLIETDWKFDKEQTRQDKKYITAYARTETPYSSKEINATLNMKMTDWLPVWWRNRSVADKTIFTLFLLSIIISLLLIKRIASSDNQIKIALVTTAAGSIFWFIQAPDPRFGFGFIIGFIAIIAGLIFRGNIKQIRINDKKILTGAVFITAVFVTGYTAYRFKNFFSGNQWIWPKGIEKESHRKITCDGMMFQIPSGSNECGDIPVPCIHDSCKTFLLRGKKITNGFKAKNN